MTVAGRRSSVASLTAAFVVLVLPAASSAQTPDTILSIDTIVVSAARPVTTTGGASATVLRIDSLRVGPAPTLEATLRQVPLVQVRRNSRGEAQIALRGSGERQVAVLVDGVPLSLGWDHRVDLSVLPALAARSVTLVRGLSSVLHGPNVLGGVVEVGVARGPFALASPPALELEIGAEHTGAQVIGLTGAHHEADGSGELLVRGGLGFRDSPGYPAAPGVAAPFRENELQRNTDVRQVDAFLALRARDARGRWLALSAFGVDAARGIAPEEDVLEPRFWRYPESQRVVGAVSAGTGLRVTPFGGSGDLEASVGYDATRVRIEQYPSLEYEAPIGAERGDTRTLSLRLLGDHTLGETAELRGALTYADVSHDEIVHDFLVELFPERHEYRQRLWSAGLELVKRLPALSGGRVSGGLVWDGADTPESGDKPPLGRLGDWGARVGATALAGDRVLVHAGASRRARFPAPRELYSGALGRFEPNPSLRPEALIAAEAGATTSLSGAELQAVAFHHRLDDAIVRATTPQGRFRRENRDQLRSTGVELLASGRVERFDIQADVTLQRVRASENGVMRVAEYQPGVAGGIEIATLLPAALRTSASLDYTGAQECVHPDRGAAELEAHATVDARAARAWRFRRGFVRDLEVAVAVDNITNATAWDQCGLARPGRTFGVRLRLR